MSDLTDRAAVNAAVAKAMGWELCCPPAGDPGGTEPWWQRQGSASRYGPAPPDYLGDAFNDEMRDTLIHFAAQQTPPAPLIMRHRLGARLEVTACIPALVRETGVTEAEALVRALGACEIVDLPKEGHG